MNFRAFAVAATLALSTLGVSSQASAATAVDISAMTPVGVTIDFDPGTYQIDFVEGLYSGWSFWGSSNPSCSESGVNCPAGFTNMFSMEQDGVDTLIIKLVAGSDYGYGMYGTLAQALAAYQAGGLSASTDGGDTYTAATQPLKFTVGPGGASIRFYINDGAGMYGDNGNGGVSLSITAVPEPAAWALMIGGFGMAGAMLRRRRVAYAKI